MTSDSNNSGRQPLPKRFTIGVPVATLASAYATPPLLYWWLGTDRWDQFWATAATPYGAATAGFAAIGAAAIALYNGTKQRETESRHASNQLKVAEGQLRHAQTTAEFDHGTRTLRELRDRFTTASQHLANTSTTIQQAGAYSLGSLVNDWLADDNQQEAQVCIDVLCTYLRTHHQEAAMHAGKPHGDDYNYNAPPPDQPIRSTITRLINSHLRADNQGPGPWSHLNYNFSESHLHYTSFRGAHFSGTAVFDEAHFTDYASFSGAQFSGRTSFRGADFKDRTDFSGANFTGYASFSGAQFVDRTSFRGADFKDQTDFNDAHFSGDTDFCSANFIGDTDLRIANFKGRTDFALANFAGHTDFRKANFDGDTYFNHGRVMLHDLTTRFVGKTDFSNVVFKGRTDFAGARFSGKTKFCSAFFDGSMIFSQAHFEGTTLFDGTEFAGTQTVFLLTHFTGETKFSEARFVTTTIFCSAKFTEGSTSFERPLEWGHVITDWDNSNSRIPEAVTPKEWPPEVVDVH